MLPLSTAPLSGVWTHGYSRGGLCPLMAAAPPRLGRAQIVLGKKIRAARTEAGYSQEAFALRVGIFRTAMGRLERGEVNPSLGTLLLIADALRHPAQSAGGGLVATQSRMTASSVGSKGSPMFSTVPSTAACTRYGHHSCLTSSPATWLEWNQLLPPSRMIA